MAQQQVVNFVFQIGSYLLSCVGIDDKLFFNAYDVNRFVGFARYYKSCDVEFPKITLKELFNVEILALPSPRRTVIWKLYDLETCIKFVAKRSGHKAMELKSIFLDDAPVVYSICTGQRSKCVSKRLPKLSVLGRSHPLRATCQSMSTVLKNLQKAYGYNPLSNVEALPESSDQCIYDPSLLSDSETSSLLSDPLLLEPEVILLEPPMESSCQPGQKRKLEMDEESQPESKRRAPNESDGPADIVKRECQSPSYLPETIVEDQTALETTVKLECPHNVSDREMQTITPGVMNVDTQTDFPIRAPSRIELIYSDGTKLSFNVLQRG